MIQIIPCRKIVSHHHQLPVFTNSHTDSYFPGTLPHHLGIVSDGMPVPFSKFAIVVYLLLPIPGKRGVQRVIKSGRTPPEKILTNRFIPDFRLLPVFHPAAVFRQVIGPRLRKGSQFIAPSQLRYPYFIPYLVVVIQNFLGILLAYSAACLLSNRLPKGVLKEKKSQYLEYNFHEVKNCG